MSSSIFTINQALKKNQRSQKDLLGTDIKFPLQDNGSGDLATVSGVDNLRQAIFTILDNISPEVIYWEGLGAGLETHVHRSANRAFVSKLVYLCEQQLMKYETRLSRVKIRGEIAPSTTPGGNDTVYLYGEYVDITYAHPGNFTYPFVLNRS